MYVSAVKTHDILKVRNDLGKSVHYVTKCTIWNSVKVTSIL